VATLFSNCPQGSLYRREGNWSSTFFIRRSTDKRKKDQAGERKDAAALPFDSSPLQGHYRGERGWKRTGGSTEKKEEQWKEVKRQNSLRETKKTIYLWTIIHNQHRALQVDFHMEKEEVHH